jgi:hypothetical protein
LSDFYIPRSASTLAANASEKFDKQRKEFTNKFSPYAYIASSSYHIASSAVLALTDANSDSAFVKGATGFTKLINSLIYTDLAIDAWKSKNTFDFISKILEPLLNCFSQLSNYHLLRGLSSAMTQLHIVNLPYIDPTKSHWDNFINNLQVTKKFFMEAWTSSFFGPNRKLFKFKNDEGHTMALISHIQAAAAVLGLINGTRRNLVDKIVGTTRNLAGVFVDFELLWRKDSDERKAGMFYIAHAALDTIKRYIPKEKADVVDNLIMPFYNAAMYHFGKITRKQSDGTYVKSVDPQKNSLGLVNNLDSLDYLTSLHLNEETQLQV